jgi:hypothetical protein
LAIDFTVAACINYGLQIRTASRNQRANPDILSQLNFSLAGVTPHKSA